MNLNIENLAVVELFGVEIWITETMVNTWIIMAIIIILAIIGRLSLDKNKLVPTGIQNAVEMIVESFYDFAVGVVGPRYSYIIPWFFAVMIYLVFSALISIFGLRSPTADWTTTFALSMCTFILMIIMGISSRGFGGYISTLFVPAWPFFPINLIGEFAKPVSLSFRLFGNMLSGTIIIIMYNSLTPLWASIGVPVLLHLIFDVFFGLLQSYIFVIISLSYINGAVE